MRIVIHETKDILFAMAPEGEIVHPGHLIFMHFTNVTVFTPPGKIYLNLNLDVSGFMRGGEGSSQTIPRQSL